jgi:hypothetical protein
VLELEQLWRLELEQLVLELERPWQLELEPPRLDWLAVLLRRREAMKGQ